MVMRIGDKEHARVGNTLRLLVIVSVFLVLFLSGVIDAEQIGQTLAHPLHFLLGACCLLLSYFFGAFRWRQLLQVQGINVSLRDTISLSFIATNSPLRAAI